MITDEEWAVKSAQWLEHCAYRERWGEEPAVNIFYLDDDPTKAAQAHCDAHVVKMILETAQLLSTVWQVTAPQMIECGLEHPHLNAPVPDGDLPWLQQRIGGARIYRATHSNHPCSHWARASAANYDWLWRLGMALADEFGHRYKGKHASRVVLWALECPPPGLPDGAQSEPPLCMPEELKLVDKDGYWDTVASYRNYYTQAKQPLLKWTQRAHPAWLQNINGRFQLLG